jgi:transcriptional regulator with XRE-family HTH domain
VKRNFNELFAKMRPEVRERVNTRSAELLEAMALADVRKAQEQTQQQLAKTLNVNQAWISRVERQTDMYLSTLRTYVEALGGHLEVTARFGESVVRLTQFESEPAVADTREDSPAAKLQAEVVYELVSEVPFASPTRVDPAASLFDRTLPDLMQLYGGAVYSGGVLSAREDEGDERVSTAA